MAEYALYIIAAMRAKLGYDMCDESHDEEVIAYLKSGQKISKSDYIQDEKQAKINSRLTEIIEDLEDEPHYFSGIKCVIYNYAKDAIFNWLDENNYIYNIIEEKDYDFEGELRDNSVYVLIKYKKWEKYIK